MYLFQGQSFEFQLRDLLQIIRMIKMFRRKTDPIDAMTELLEWKPHFLRNINMELLGKQNGIQGVEFHWILDDLEKRFLRKCDPKIFDEAIELLTLQIQQRKINSEIKSQQVTESINWLAIIH